MQPDTLLQGNGCIKPQCMR